MIFRLFLIFCIVLAACTAVPAPLPHRARCPRRVDTFFRVDPAFSISERDDIRGAVSDWEEYSSGCVSYRLRFDWDPVRDRHEPQIIRQSEYDPAVTWVELSTQSRVNGWFWSDPDRIYLVPERVRPEHFRQLAVHELGHAARLALPGCSKPNDCAHSPDPTAVMHATFRPAKFGPSDYELCRQSGVCL